MTNKSHCFSGLRKRYHPTHRINYNKTIGVYTPKYKPVKKGNKVKFAMWTQVTVAGQRGKIADCYEFGNVLYYCILWNEVHQSWYDTQINKKSSKYGWIQSRHIRKVDVVD